MSRSHLLIALLLSSCASSAPATLPKVMTAAPAAAAPRARAHSAGVAACGRPWLDAENHLVRALQSRHRSLHQERLERCQSVREAADHKPTTRTGVSRLLSVPSPSAPL